MLSSPVDIAIVAGIILIVFGPKEHPPWRWKVETNEKRDDRKGDPFQEEKPDSFLSNDETQPAQIS